MKTDLKHLYFTDYYGDLIPDLSFSFWKRDLQTIEDENVIRDLIDLLFNAHCCETTFHDDLDTFRAVINAIPYKKVGLLVSSHRTGRPELYCFNANQKNDLPSVSPIQFQNS